MNLLTKLGSLLSVIFTVASFNIKKKEIQLRKVLVGLVYLK